MGGSVVALLMAVVGLSVSSRVDSVVVYPQQVQVVRVASVTVDGGGEMVFPGLPGGMDDNTVRIRCAGLRIGEVQVRRGYLAEPTPEVKVLQASVEGLEDELKALEAEEGVLKAREEFLNSVKLGSPELIARELQQGKVAPDAWRSALAFLADELMKARKRAIVLAREKAAKQQELNAARQQYSAARALVEDRKQVSFDYDAEPGTYELEVSYVISSGASWSPYYELRARPGEGTADMTYFAKLAQRTGEDWERVRVVLSTAMPAAGQTAPQPVPWYLTLYEVVRRLRFSGVMAEAKAMPAPGAPAMDQFAADVEETQVVETGIALQYVVPGRVSLKSGEPAKKLQLHEARLPAEFEYYALPRVSQQAYLTGRLVNVTDFVLLAGAGNTYVGDEYTGSTWLATAAPQETVPVSFGTDDRVKVKHELVRSYKTRAGLLGRSENQQFVYRTVIENRQPKPVAIRVVEQVPVSQQGEIKVSVTKVEPQFLERDEDKGTYTWKPILSTGQKFTIDLEFTVEYPSGREVQGLY
jgi:uncharacterized protein (TIGR02231 family)